MKEEILKIAEDLKNGVYSEEESKSFLLELFGVDQWVLVSECEPPKDIEILAKSPEGIVHLCNWREAYKIFTVQAKYDDSSNWHWKYV
jgi:hypothetical protein